MTLYVGTSGYSYKEWKGAFYPEDLPQADMLRYYAERLGTVEINATFYRMPTEKVLLQWAEQVPNTFTFVLKVSRRITHLKRLSSVDEEMDYVLRTASVLGNNLGALLFQLPPNFKKDLAKLAAFFTLLPKKGRAAIEFRNQTWFDDAVYDALRERNVALVVAETDEGGETPLVRTADWGYLRLRSQQYQQEDLRAWADRVREQQWNDAFVFFKHEDEATGPLFAAQFDKIYGS